MYLLPQRSTFQAYGAEAWQVRTKIHAAVTPGRVMVLRNTLNLCRIGTSRASDASSGMVHTARAVRTIDCKL